jgi:hypothetical protein
LEDFVYRQNLNNGVITLPPPSPTAYDDAFRTMLNDCSGREKSMFLQKMLSALRVTMLWHS